jgi:hypothetical protein
MVTFASYREATTDSDSKNRKAKSKDHVRFISSDPMPRDVQKTLIALIGPQDDMRQSGSDSLRVNCEPGSRQTD